MALTRARPIFGSAQARGAVQRIIDATLAKPNDAAAITADAAKMRRDIAAHKPPAGAFDVKLIEGGLVDAEFAVHLLQLREGIGLDPRLAVAAAALAAAGLIAPGFAAAHALLSRMLITLRLVAPKSDEPPVASQALVARACGLADWAALVAAYADARALIGGEWRRVAGLG
jgi:glutamate-ammonia-ligase adenylyltransferase